MKTIRIALQLLFFILMTYTVTLTFNGLRAIYTAFLHNDFNMQFLFPKIIPVIAIIPITILLGRFFCGWMCAFGTIGDMVYLLSGKLMKHKIMINEKVDRLLKYVKYLILVGCIVLIWTFNITFFSKFSAWDAFGLLPNVYAAFGTFLIGSIVFIFIIIGSFFIERFFCRYLCPLGAFFTVTSKLRILKIKKPTEKCGKCRICTNNCPMGIPLYRSEIVTSGECIDCMHCLQICPRRNTNLVINDAPLNPIIAGTLAVATIAYINYGADLVKNVSSISNPGISNESSAMSGSSNQTVTQNKKYIDGTYTGVADGFRPDLNVTVTIKNDRITSVIIGANNESPGYCEEPFAVIPQEIISAQSTDVAVVSGATYSSNGIKNAVADALSKALISNNPTSSQTFSNNETNSQASNASVNPAVLNTTTSLNTSSNTSNSSSSANNIQPSNAPNMSSQDSIISGSSIASSSSSKVPSSSSSESSSSIQKYKDGTYTGVATGYEPNLNVTVTIQNSKITSIIIGANNETRPLSAFTVIPNEIINSQSTSVAVVSGATYSSNGIKNAVADALSKAENQQ